MHGKVFPTQAVLPQDKAAAIQKTLLCNRMEFFMMYIQTVSEATPFLLRAPYEIRQELSSLEECVKDAKEKLSRLYAVKEELEEFALPEEVVELVETELLERIETVREEIDEMASDAYALSEELEETVYLLYQR